MQVESRDWRLVPACSSVDGVVGVASRHAGPSSRPPMSLTHSSTKSDDVILM